MINEWDKNEDKTKGEVIPPTSEVVATHNQWWQDERSEEAKLFENLHVRIYKNVCSCIVFPNKTKALSRVTVLLNVASS
jgi:hypothetical protein